MRITVTQTTTIDIDMGDKHMPGDFSGLNAAQTQEDTDLKAAQDREAAEGATEQQQIDAATAKSQAEDAEINKQDAAPAPPA